MWNGFILLGTPTRHWIHRNRKQKKNFISNMSIRGNDRTECTKNNSPRKNGEIFTKNLTRV